MNNLPLQDIEETIRALEAHKADRIKQISVLDREIHHAKCAYLRHLDLWFHMPLLETEHYLAFTEDDFKQKNSSERSPNSFSRSSTLYLEDITYHQNTCWASLISGSYSSSYRAFVPIDIVLEMRNAYIDQYGELDEITRMATELRSFKGRADQLSDAAGKMFPFDLWDAEGTVINVIKHEWERHHGRIEAKAYEVFGLAIDMKVLPIDMERWIGDEPPGEYYEIKDFSWDEQSRQWLVWLVPPEPSSDDSVKYPSRPSVPVPDAQEMRQAWIEEHGES